MNKNLCDINLQFWLIFSELRHKNLQLWEIKLVLQDKMSQLPFFMFYWVVETGFHNKQSTAWWSSTDHCKNVKYCGDNLAISEYGRTIVTLNVSGGYGPALVIRLAPIWERKRVGRNTTACLYKTDRKLLSFQRMRKKLTSAPLMSVADL